MCIHYIFGLAKRTPDDNNWFNGTKSKEGKSPYASYSQIQKQKNYSQRVTERLQHIAENNRKLIKESIKGTSRIIEKVVAGKKVQNIDL